MSRFWSEIVGTLTPYVPGEQPQHDSLVKLNTNESADPPSPEVLKAIAAVSADSLRRYPDPQSQKLKQAFADRNGLQPDQVFLGNGSDEVIAFAFMALLKQQAPLYFADVTYSFYPVWSKLCDIEFCEVPVTDELGIDVDAYPENNGGIILPNPNAPTGKLLPLDDIRRLLQRSCDSVVVIDEAYIDFGGESAVSLIDEFENLLVVQTLSKSRAMAGIRVGVAMGNAQLIEALDRVKNSFNSYPLDVIAQAAALASLQDDAYFRSSCLRVIATRDTLSADLTSLGFEVLPSSANFVFARHGEHAALELFNVLRERGIILRYFDKPRIDNFLRISVGTPEQCEVLVSALEELLAG